MDDGKLEIKPIYDNAILKGTITGAELTKRFYGRTRAKNNVFLFIQSKYFLNK